MKNHMSHLKIQLPYALVVATAASLVYLVIGLFQEEKMSHFLNLL